MSPNRLLTTGIVGFILSMLGCVTPALVALLAAVGISGSMGWLDSVLLPAMAIFVALVVYGVISRKHRAPRMRRSELFRLISRAVISIADERWRQH